MKRHTPLYILISFSILTQFIFPWADFSEADAGGLVLAVTEKEETQAFRWYTYLYNELGKRLGMDIQLQYYPPKRASVISNKGIVDGEAGRIRTYGGLNPNLIRVENKITSHVFSAFTLNPSIQLDGWKSLKSIDHIVVGYRLGITGTEAVLPRLINGDNLSPVTNTYLGLRMLIKRRIDVYVDGEAAVRHWLQTDEFQDAGIKKAGEMAKVTIHCYLHKKHMELVPKLSNMIGELRKKNLIKKYYWKAVRETESTDTGQENPLGLPPTL